MILDATMGTLQRSSSVQKMKETPEEWMSLLNSRCCSSAINNYNKYKHCVYNQTCVQRVKRVRNARFVAVKFKGAIYSKGTFALKKSERESFLPPAKEVWGKVIFSQASIILFMVMGAGRGWFPSMHHRSHDQGVCIQGSMHRGGGLHPWGSASKGRGSASWGVGGSGGSASG